MKKAFLVILCCAAINTWAQHTFSIVAVDPLTGEIGSAGATCGDTILWPGTPGAKLISSVMPGKFAVHTQAYHIAANQANADARMLAGDSPQQAIDWLVANDAEGDSTKRQYGIVDYNNGNPRSAAFTGSNCDNYKNHITGPGYSIQGNILLGQQILDSIQSKFLNTQGSLARRLMAALQGAKVPGVDTRCMSNGTSSLSAFLRVAKPTDQPDHLFIDVNVGAVPAGTEPINVLQVKVNEVLSVDEQAKPSYLYRLYPNPASGKAQLEFSTTLPEQITVTDAMGKLVSTYAQNDIHYSMALDISRLGNGIYFIRFYKDGMPAHNDRLVVQ